MRCWGIKPGEDCPRGTLDLAGMAFDFSFLSEKTPPETPLVEIRPVVAISAAVSGGHRRERVPGYIDGPSI